MALPIMLNLRYVTTAQNKVFMALANFSVDDSGVLFECEYDAKFDAPWGIRIDQVKGREFGFFKNLSDEKLQKFADAMSQLVNAYYGFDSTGKPIPLSQAELPVKLAEQVFTFGTREDAVELIPLGVTQKELMEKAPQDIAFVAAMPKELLDPSNTQKVAANH